METRLASVVDGTRGLGLQISLQKTEAGGPPRSWIMVGGSCVQVGDQINYLGLLLDGRWRFDVHFDRLAARLGVVRSMALYGAPIWAGALMVRRCSRQLLRRVKGGWPSG